MSILLSPEQQSAIDARPGEPVAVLDERTNTAFMLVPADVYERLTAVPEYDDSDHPMSDWYPAISESFGRAGWDDPIMDEYNNYEENYRKLHGEPK
jgi:hypothetical protein